MDRVPVPPNTVEQARQAMGVLKRLLEGTPLRSLKGARPVAFELDGQVFTLDPRAPSMFVDGAAADVALTVRTSPAVLLRLLTTPEVWMDRHDRFKLEGEARALRPIIESLQGGQSPLHTLLGAAKG